MTTVLQGKFSAYLGWSQPFLHELIDGVHRRGVRCVVLCNRTENSDRFPPPNLHCAASSALGRVVPATAEALRIQERWQPDVMHAHFGWSGIRMLLLKQMLRVPLVTTFGGRDLGVQRRLPEFRPLYDELLAQCDRILCVSRDLCGPLEQLGVPQEKIRVVHRGVNLGRFRFVDRSHHPAAAPVRFLMVGRLVEKKGHEFALRALAELRAAGRRFELDVVGDGDERRRLVGLARELGVADAVSFHGTRTPDAVVESMRHADVLLHCSITPEDGDREGIPNAVVEAAATGLPVVGTRHGGIPEVVTDGSTGLLVGERDTAALAHALGRLADDRELRLSLGKAGSRAAHAGFDIEAQIDAHVRLYEELARARREGRLRQRPLPEAFPAHLARVFGSASAPAEAAELSVSELLSHALEVMGGSGSGGLGDERTALRHAEAIRRAVPAPLRRALKRPLALGLGSALGLAVRLTGASDPRERARLRERRLFAHFRSGRPLAAFRSTMRLEEIDAILEAESAEGG